MTASPTATSIATTTWRLRVHSRDGRLAQSERPPRVETQRHYCFYSARAIVLPIPASSETRLVMPESAR